MTDQVVHDSPSCLDEEKEEEREEMVAVAVAAAQEEGVEEVEPQR